MQGLKNVRHRRTDALTQVRWDQLESLLAGYYREQGYTVDHCGTGATSSRFDGGIDLKLRKDDAYILVQCKHWNAKQVPHNAVHELMGLMVNEGATGVILVTSGEFTRAAIEAATRQGHVQLVDGDDLRGGCWGRCRTRHACAPKRAMRDGTPLASICSTLHRTGFDMGSAHLVVVVVALSPTRWVPGCGSWCSNCWWPSSRSWYLPRRLNP